MSKDGRQIMQEFGVRWGRQLLAIGVALFLVFFLAVLYNRPTVLREFSKNTLFGLQVIVIAAFVGFSSLNWRCPSCNKYLGNDMNRRVCRKCGSRLRQGRFGCLSYSVVNCAHVNLRPHCAVAFYKRGTVDLLFYFLHYTSRNFPIKKRKYRRLQWMTM